MPFKDRENLLAWRETPKFKERNYAHVKAWRAKPENKAKRAAEADRWRKRHPDVWDAIKKRFRGNHLESIRAKDATAAAAKRRADPEGQRIRVARFKEKREAERVALAGRPKPEVCDICGQNIIRIVFDHCHARGHFRGWICDRCNRVLGLMKDDAGLPRKLADYLERD